MSHKKLESFQTLVHNIRVYFFWSVFGVGSIVIGTCIFALASEPYTLKFSPRPFGFQLVNEQFYMDELRARTNYDAVKPRTKPAVKSVKPTPKPTAIMRAPLSSLN